MMIKLVEMKRGQKAKILEFHGHHGRRGGSVSRLENMGLRRGEIVEMLSNQNIGPLLLRAVETRVAIGRGIASKVLVDIISEEEHNEESA